MIDKLKACASYCLRVFCGLGNGGYWGLSVFTLIFGIYFLPLTGGLSLLIPIFATISSILMVMRNISEENKERNAKKAAEQKLAIAISSLEQEGFQNPIPTNQPVEVKSFKAKTWVFIKRTLTRGREFLNSMKNATKLLYITTALAGVGLDFFLSGGAITFSLVLTSVLIFAGACAIDYHRRRSRKRKTDKLIQQTKQVDEEYYSQKYPIQGDENFNAPYELHHATFKEKFLNKCNMGLRWFTGVVHGGYFGFTIMSMIFGQLIMPLVVLNPLAAIIVPVCMSAIMLLLQVFRHNNQEKSEQSKNKSVLDERHENKQRLTRLLVVAKHYTNNEKLKAFFQEKFGHEGEISEREMETYLNAIIHPSKPPRSKIKKLGDFLWSMGAGACNRIRECGRAIKNSTKFGIGIIITAAALTSTPFIAAGWPVFVGFGSFMLFFGALAIVEYSIRDYRNRKVKQFQNEADLYKAEMRALQILVHEAQNPVDIDLSTGTEIPLDQSTQTKLFHSKQEVVSTLIVEGSDKSDESDVDLEDESMFDPVIVEPSSPIYKDGNPHTMFTASNDETEQEEDEITSSETTTLIDKSKNVSNKTPLDMVA